MLMKEERLQAARTWADAYRGMDMLRAYKAYFDVCTTTAVEDLKELGCRFIPRYIEVVMAEDGEERHLAH
ncbi:MAG: hypothetical protein FWC69_02715 [Defluviitaleaceae bacterium]|nr:hypothetical protein [Defluviitaleaceae bacterium]